MYERNGKIFVFGWNSETIKNANKKLSANQNGRKYPDGNELRAGKLSWVS